MADKAPPADAKEGASANPAVTAAPGAEGDHTTLTVPPAIVQSDEPAVPVTKVAAAATATAHADKTATDASTSTTVLMGADAGEPERCCWICFATDEDNRLAAWVKPCQCRGTTKWVHQSCLYRWIDEKTQKGNALRSVSCPQCQTEYIIVFPQMGKFGGALEAMDNLIKRLSPFLAAGFFVGSLYWTAVTYGAVTFLQIVGHENGMSIMEAGDPLVLLIGLPAIPVGLVLGRLIRWEDALLRLIRNRGTVVRKFPFVSLIYPNLNQEDEQQSTSNPATPALSDPVSATRVFCGALLLPTISSIVGRILFDSVDNTLHRTLLGGLTFITVKGILKIYLKQKQYASRKKRRIVDYTEENIRTYMHRSNTSAGAARQDQPAQNQQQRPVPPTLRLDAVAIRERELNRQPGDSGGSVV
ncbi:E3 ubiquitin-protein ligase MARCH5 [Drosophila serrata]|uniref:E3 ubiquitin-protein ligase MARCH5 n=1 Tax=Drosophila serrata TaxID=7274 RepID=UPI000A1D2EAE|nr:E3 ubiquitin-protein ligase MARCH5 [Drosophila serrata]XP_020798488.1 E3 ubiquitin-protein ligase MARCH5 [Drosophila serrata]